MHKLLYIMGLGISLLLPMQSQGEEIPLALDSPKERLRICILDHNPPYVFFDENYQRQGYDMDMLQALELPYTLEFFSTDMATGLAMLDNDTCQMLLSNTTMNEQLKERFLFSHAHLQSNLHALVLAQSPLQSNDALPSSIVGVLRDTPAEDFVFEEFTDATIIALRHGEDLLAALYHGDIEALIDNKLNLMTLQNQHQHTKMLEPALKEQEYAYIFSKKHPELRDEVSAKIERLQQENILLQLHDKWFTKKEIHLSKQ